jgi:hypothetical protein
MEIIGKAQKAHEKYICEKCDFVCSYLRDWNRHIARPKHQNIDFGNDFENVIVFVSIIVIQVVAVLLSLMLFYCHCCCFIVMQVVTNVVFHSHVIFLVNIIAVILV